MKNPSVLALIPARAGSKRIPGKNTRTFFGKPLIAHTILQARALAFVDRIIVDTDSPEIARISKRWGAEVPFLRPAHLAGDKAKVADSVIHLLNRLKRDQNYVPDYVLLLQTTSPLRELKDIKACWARMKKGDANAVITIIHTHPMLFHVINGFIVKANKEIKKSSNMQAWPDAYLPNGCFVYIIPTKVFLKKKTFIPDKTAAVVSPRWRSVDLDLPEDWVMAEFLWRNRKKIEKALKRFH